MQLNHYPLWKNLLLAALVVVAFIYALPNFYGDDPAIQISGVNNTPINAALLEKITSSLNVQRIGMSAIKQESGNILIRFRDADTQLQAKDFLKTLLGDDYTIALNLAPTTPNWLRRLNATPMKLGLDLRGGIHLTLDVDINSVISQRLEGLQRTISDDLRDENIRYTNIRKQNAETLWIAFADQENLNNARAYLSRHFYDFKIVPNINNNQYSLLMSISEQGIDNMRQGIMDQTMTTLRNRVNELGISEATVQQSGLSHISVEMPGVLDSARAQQILGGTATVEMRMVDVEHDPHAPTLGSTLYDDNGKPVLLKNQVILSGSSITDAQASADESGLPAVNISLGGGSEALFHRTTALNIGKPMSIVYVENKIKEHNDGKGHITKTNVKSERIISVATIRSALPNNFQITGLGSAEEAQNLSLLLRAGALPATINIIEERTLGPKLGLDNINKGIFSVKIGMAIVIVFMALYYGVFGLISDLALLCNMLLLIALLSALGMTLTLAGIAGIVLTVGLAVDSNVLIFERIREELRNGAQIQTAIFSGFDRAFVTIVDANITTLIVALVLFGIGTGPVKGFAVTLSVGILTSMISAMGITRALVNLTYGRRKVKKISIGL